MRAVLTLSLAVLACMPAPTPVDSVPEPTLVEVLDCPVPAPLGGVQPRCRIGSSRTELLIVNQTGFTVEGFATMGSLVRDFSIGDGLHASLVGDCAARMDFGVRVGDLVIIGTPGGRFVFDGYEFVRDVDYRCGQSLTLLLTLNVATEILSARFQAYSTGPEILSGE